MTAKPVSAVAFTLPAKDVTVFLTNTSAFLLNNITSAPAWIAAFAVTAPCAVISTSPSSDYTVPSNVTLPAEASTSTFWSDVTAPRRTISPWVALAVIVPFVAVNVPVSAV